MKNIFKCAWLCSLIAALFLISVSLYAEDDGSMSKEEMTDEIYEKLDVFQEIMNSVPGLSAAEISKGKFEYYFEVEEELVKKNIKIADLDREKLYGLFVKVSNEFTRLNTERTLKQIEATENLNNIMRIQEQSENMQNMEREQSRLRARVKTGSEATPNQVRINWTPPTTPNVPPTQKEK